MNHRSITTIFVLFALLVSTLGAHALPRSIVPEPLLDADMQSHAFHGGTHVVAYAGGRIIGIDDATGSNLWSLIEPEAERTWDLAAYQESFCGAFLRGDGSGYVRCFRLADGIPQWKVELPQGPFRIDADANRVVVGDRTGAVHAYDSAGLHQWSTPPVDASAGVYALALGAQNVVASILHKDADGNFGIDGRDHLVVIDRATGNVLDQWDPQPANADSHRAAYALLAVPDGWLAGLDAGHLLRLNLDGTMAAQATAGHDVAVTTLAAGPGGIATGALLGVLSLHDATTLAPKWSEPRTHHAGNTVGLAWTDNGLVSAHRTGWLLSSGTADAATGIILAPEAGTAFGGAPAARVSLSRQGPEASVPVTVEWRAPGGQTYPAYTGNIIVDAFPRVHDVPLDAANAPDGTGYRLQLTVQDELGASTSRGRGPVLLDRSPPTVLTLDPAPGAVLTTAPDIIATTWNDVTAGIDPAKSQVWINGVRSTHEVERAGQSRAEPPSMADGDYEIRSVAVDRSGNGADVRWTFRVDAQTPVIQAMQQESAGPNYVRISWETNEPAACTAGVNQAPPPARPTAAAAKSVHGAVLRGLQQDTAHEIVIRCVDRAGLEATPARETYQTSNDNSDAPVLTVVAPTGAEGAWFIEPVALEATWDRAGELYASMNGGPFTQTTSPVAVPEGETDVRLIVLAPSGSSNQWQETFRVDTQPPTVPVVTAPAVAGAAVDVRWTGGLDGDEPAPQVEVQIEQNGAFESLASFLAPRSGLVFEPVEGTHTYRIVAIDRAGHQTPSESFTIHSEWPDVPRIQAEWEGPSEFVATGVLRLRAHVPDQSQPLLRVLVDGEEVLRDAAPTAFDVDGLRWWSFRSALPEMPAGAHEVHILGADFATKRLPFTISGNDDGGGGETIVKGNRDTPWAGVFVAPALLGLAAWRRNHP